ncbi:MAG TPA: HAD family hydrolase [Henriciella marina]|uniref:sulfotransferase-like domain-containing protein n=1 Tax=Henriciella sp. TaxID=1968823 RepID=UPI0018597B71|nr:HAD family hydrolase [Henriciella sp.]HIG23916.1 HAD family hydrolase [Henriciella sp.]HIK64779.1 HAD family hydrolase [Henriciella marina]
MSEPVRIAMWSGPRNLSTTMMRSFGARADTACVDEPFYAAYLVSTGTVHPMQAEILDAQAHDGSVVAQELSEAPVPGGKPVFYQKHMTHHMAPSLPRGWMHRVTNAFLIRDPARVLASYARKMETVSLEAIGVPQQAELFDRVCQIRSEAPPVVDSDDILADPAGMLRALCAALGIAYTDAMLSWEAGPKPEDGVWAPHWYDAVWQSTGFGAPRREEPALPDALRKLADEARQSHEAIAAHRLKPKSA